MAKTAEELYQERKKRILDAVALRKPDRVPIVGPYQLFPYEYAGVSFKDAMNDYALAREVCHKFVDDFEPDADFGPVFAYPAKPMETLGVKWFKWAGHGLPDNVMYQFIEGEYMTADEYDEFIYDPSHFMASKWLPRSFKALEGFNQYPPMRRMMWFGWTGLLLPFATPEMQESLRLAAQAAEELGEWFGSLGQYGAELKEKGFPQAYAGLDWTPFDIVGDTLRGTRGVMGDIIRRPKKLLKAVEVATQISIEYGLGAKGAELPFCWIWPHKGSAGFMSDEQYATFYWPFLRTVLEELIANDITPVVYFEGDETPRLKYFKEVPPGKCWFHFATMDMKLAKQELGDIACISGNLPSYLLLTGTPDDARACAKELIDTVGEDGGYIMDTSVMLDEAKPENVKAMFEFTKEYGVY
jgi:uroporphyrinogen-III decarboxylase